MTITMLRRAVICSALAGAVAACAGCGGGDAEPTTPAAKPTAAAAKQLEERKLAECNALIEVINTGVAALEGAPQSSSRTMRSSQPAVDDLTVMAAMMEEIASAAAKVQVTTPELERLSGEYQTMARQVGAGARALITAARAHDAAGVQAAHETVKRAAAREDPIVDEINEFCQS
jgi:hypothetical protein